MRDELRDRLRASLSTVLRPGVAPVERQDGPAPGALFLRDFLARAERVVVPAMVEAGRLIEAQGRFYAVERIPERRTCRGLLVPAAVQISVFRRHRTVNFKNGAPHFSVACDRAQRRVLFRRTVSAPEEVGSCALEALTRDRVQAGIIDMLDALARQ